MEGIALRLGVKLLALVTLPIIFSGQNLLAQELSNLQTKKDLGGRVISAVNNNVQRTRHPRSVFNKRARQQQKNVAFNDRKNEMKTIAATFGVSNTEKVLSLVSRTQDEMGIIHERYAQSYNEIPFFGAGELIVHWTEKGDLLGVSGKMMEVSLNTTPVASSKKASNIAVKNFKSLFATKGKRKLLKSSRGRCKKEKSSKRENICIRKSRRLAVRASTISVVGVPKLYIYNEGMLSNKTGFPSYLVWEVKVKTVNGEITPTYLIDASTGDIRYFDFGMRHISREVYDCSYTGVSGNVCYLDTSRFVNGANYFFGRSEGQPSRGPNPLDPPYSGSSDVDDMYEYYIPNMRQYYMDRFGRDDANGIGGTGDGINLQINHTRAFVHTNDTAQGLLQCTPGFAWANPDVGHVAFCAGSLTADASDVFAHEYSHILSGRLNQNGDGSWNKLGGFFETGALNENFSDVMGEGFEFFLTGSNNWDFGGGGNHIVYRSLSDPPTVTSLGNPVPDRYYHPDFYCGDGSYNFGGIHHNATVPGKAAYLASVGGTFNGCTINGIGLQKVEQIWYRALTQYYTTTETFNMAYNSLRLACADLYSAADCDELTKALQAVEMDQPGACSGVPALPPACATGSCKIVGSFGTI